MALKVSQKDPKHEKKEPLSDRVTVWFSQHLKAIIWVVVLLVLAIGGVYGYMAWQENTEKKSAEQFQAALTAYQTALNEKEQEIGLGMTAEGLKKLMIETYPVAEKEFGPLVVPNSKYVGQKIAKLEFADISRKSEQADRALELYIQLIDEFADDTILQQRVLMVLGGLYEDKQDLARAAEMYKRIIDDEKFVIKDEALFSIGRVYAQEKNIEESSAAYQRVVDEYATSPYANLAKSEIAQLPTALQK